MIRVLSMATTLLLVASLPELSAQQASAPLPHFHAAVLRTTPAGGALWSTAERRAELNPGLPDRGNYAVVGAVAGGAGLGLAAGILGHQFCAHENETASADCGVGNFLLNFALGATVGAVTGGFIGSSIHRH